PNAHKTLILLICHKGMRLNQPLNGSGSSEHHEGLNVILFGELPLHPACNQYRLRLIRCRKPHVPALNVSGHGLGAAVMEDLNQAFHRQLVTPADVDAAKKPNESRHDDLVSDL